MVNTNSRIGRRRFLQGSGAAVTTTALGSSATATKRPNKKATNDVDSIGQQQDEDPNIIAHRGFAGKYPENTIAAMSGSARDGADMIEIDVVPCADGEIVAFHDNGLSERDGGEQGLTNADGLVWETDCETVLNAEVLGSGQTIPTLREVMKTIPSSIGINIEMKNPGSKEVFAGDLNCQELETQEELWRPFVRKVLSIADEFQNNILVSSFYEAALSTTRETDSSIPIAFLFGSDIEGGLNVTREYDAEALHPSYDLIQGTPFFEGKVDIDLVDVAHEEGRKVNVWTVQTWYQATQLAKTDLDGLIVDYPDLI